mmetsp:Transcript_27321/g.39126  ORF Transcript_27321/g.39126 Transcript_27321/m.39126 type:complete len:89 (-) Transcript_27321:29-295(-)
MVSSLEFWSSGMKSPSLEFRNGVLFWRKSIIPIICWVELEVVEASPPRLPGSKTKAWLSDGVNAKRSSCISNSGSDCVIVMVSMGCGC